jgi:hypothetical protein
MGRTIALLVFAAMTLGVGCDRAESVASDSLGRAASAAADKSRELSDGASDKSKQLADDAKEGAKKKLAELGDGAAKYVDGRLKAMMAGAKDGSLEAQIRDGRSSATEVLRIAKAMSDAVSSETTVLPIYRPVRDQEKVDQDIADMPRTEVIDGVTVGFKRVRELSNSEKVDEDAYLVLWRRDDEIVGFVYQKKSRIDLDALVKETPRLMKLVSGS